MKVLDLRCAHGHAFEGWFGSEADYAAQRESGLLACPVCGACDVVRVPSAARLNLSGAAAAAAAAAAAGAGAGAAAGAGPAPPRTGTAAPSRAQDGQGSGDAAGTQPGGLPSSEAEAHQTRLLQLARELVHRAEDVGPRFAEEARRIHHGEAEPRSIRGQASVREAAALHEEGIEVLPLPAALAQTLQ